MGLVTYIHTYNLHTFLYDGCCAGKRETCRLAGWLAGWLHSVNQPNVPETWSTLRLCLLCLSLSLSLPRSPHQISFLSPVGLVRPSEPRAWVAPPLPPLAD